MNARAFIASAMVVASSCVVLQRPLAAQVFRIGGGAGDRGGQIGGQGQASVELGPQTSGFGVRMDLIYNQTTSPALSAADAVRAGRTMRTYAPFIEARIHRWQGNSGNVALASRERQLVSALVGLRF